MNVPPCRRFNLGDAMIAVATVALIFALRPVGLNYDRAIRNVWSAHSGGQRYLQLAVMLCRFLTSPWLCLTIGWACCRLRKPRPPLQQLREQPGFMAGLAALAMAGWALLPMVIFRSHHPEARPFAHDLFDLSDPISPAVIGSWLCLRTVGRWQPEPGWIDRSGRLLGWGWIALDLTQRAAWSFLT